MKGIVFTEFLEMVEEKFGLEAADRIIAGASLASEGAYTAVGTYDHAELVRLVARLSDETGIAVAELVRTFGEYLFAKLAAGYPQAVAGVSSTFALLERIEDHIHREVRKLYPDAELPTIECRRCGDDRLELVYRSSRPFAGLAEGLIRGCVAHFGERISVEREDRSTKSESRVCFRLNKRPND